MEELRGLGTEQTRKTYRRHGVTGDLFGVSYADLGKLKKRLKVNHALALELWDSGNHDARTLATMVADPRTVSADELDRWVREAGCHGLVDAVAGLAARTPHAQDLAAGWREDPQEMVARAGWQTVAHLAVADGLPDEFFVPFLARVEREVHGERNRVRQAMNGVLIAIGGRGEALAEMAIAAARRIGPVDVDHGDTECKTPEPEPYIRKMLARGRKAARLC
ncbi:MAG TPA: DNA alkylation repair protein [Longimicrobiaceae bacterium]|nr:DNA alkylation repair protein [Longimicrobiaceae bacterium]